VLQEKELFNELVRCVVVKLLRWRNAAKISCATQSSWFPCQRQNINIVPVFAATMQGKITAQGKLLLQDTLLVMEQTSKAPRSEKQALRERRVFLFEQIIIVSEEIDKRKNNMSSPGYIYKNSIKV
jgi:hypothetical protein